MNQPSAQPTSPSVAAAKKSRLHRLGSWLYGLRQRPWFWMMAGAIAAAIIWILFDWVFFDSTIRIDKATTFVTGPLDSNGEIDFEAALNDYLSDGITPDDNAAVPLLTAFGVYPLPEWSRERFCEALGIDPLPDDGEDFRRHLYGPKDDVSAQFRFESHSYTRPWTDNDFPEWAEWLRSLRHCVLLAREAAKKPHFYCPLVGDSEWDRGFSFLGFMQAIRGLVRLLNYDATYQLGAGNWRAAAVDALAIQKIGEHLMTRGDSFQWHLGAHFVTISLRLQTNLCHFIPDEHQTELIDLFRHEAIDAPGAVDACRWTHRLQSAAKLVEISKAYSSWRWVNPPIYNPAADSYMREQHEAAMLTQRLAGRAVQLRYARIDWGTVLESIGAVLDEEAAIQLIDDRNQRRQRLEAFDERLKQGRSQSLILDLCSRSIRTSTVARN